MSEGLPPVVALIQPGQGPYKQVVLQGFSYAGISFTAKMMGTSATSLGSLSPDLSGDIPMTASAGLGLQQLIRRGAANIHSRQHTGIVDALPAFIWAWQRQQELESLAGCRMQLMC